MSERSRFIKVRVRVHCHAFRCDNVQRMRSGWGDLVRVDDVAALPGELVVERFNDGAQKDVAGALSLVLVGIEVEPAEEEEAV